MAEWDRLKQALQGFVNAAMKRVDYLALYPARVASQNADGTLELAPDDPRLPSGLSAIRIRSGVPGVTIKVAAGTRVLVGFDAGRPDLPYAALWDAAGTVTELDVDATTIKLNGGSAGVARNGDEVTISILQFASAGAANGGGPVTITSPLKGSISGGSSSVKAG